MNALYHGFVYKGFNEYTKIGNYSAVRKKRAEGINYFFNGCFSVNENKYICIRLFSHSEV